MSGPIPLAHFDRGKPFYPLIMQYVIQLVGFKELGVRGLIGTPDVKQFIQKLTGIGEENSADVATLSMKLAELLGPLKLGSSVSTERLEVPADDIAKELVSNVQFLSKYFFLSAGNILILAHELCKDKLAHDTGLLWEFLHHCRNAAGHGGKFNFLHGEPKRLAKWRGLEILPKLQGTSLFKGEDGKGLLSPADPILLLWDIEQAYPNIA